MFSDFCIPLMLQVAPQRFHAACLPDGWALRLIDCILKVSGRATGAKLRATVLQTVNKQWRMTIQYLQVSEQMLQQLTHKRQLGCMKGRAMQHRILQIASGFHPQAHCALKGFEFSNTFPTLSHKYIEAVLQLNQLPAAYSQFFFSTLISPFSVCLCSGPLRAWC